MQNKFIYLFLSVCFFHLPAFCGNRSCANHEKFSGIKKHMEVIQHEIEMIGKERDKEKIHYLKMNIQYLENNVNKKLKKAQVRLEKYKVDQSNSENEMEMENRSKKIESIEKKINAYSDMLFTIQIWKEKITA